MNGQRRTFWTLILAYVAFVSLGLPDGLLGVAWPSIRHGFGLPVDRLGLLLLMMTAGYTVASFSSGPMTQWLGVGGVLAGSCAVTSASLFGYSFASAWALMVPMGLLTGLGAGAIDASLNAYVSAHHSPRSVSWMHAAFGLGISTGPLLMTFGLASGRGWPWGYRVVGLGQAALAVAFVATRRLWRGPSPADGGPTEPKARLKETLRLPRAWLGVALFWGYVGLEATTGQWMFTLYTEGRGVAGTVAGLWVSAFWGALMAGRVLLGALSNAVPVGRMIGGCLAVSMLAVGIVWTDPSPMLRLPALLTLGFCLAPIFPLSTAATPARLGSRHAANGIGMQIAAAGLGAALEPGAVGWLAGRFGLSIIGPALAIMGIWTAAAHCALLAAPSLEAGSGSRHVGPLEGP